MSEDVDVSASGPCQIMHDYGLGRVACSSCRGKGEWVCTCNCGDRHEIECSRCYGCGYVPCGCRR